MIDKVCYNDRRNWKIKYSFIFCLDMLTWVYNWRNFTFLAFRYFIFNHILLYCTFSFFFHSVFYFILFYLFLFLFIYLFIHSFILQCHIPFIKARLWDFLIDGIEIQKLLTLPFAFRQSLCKIPKFQLISRCTHFVETPNFCIVLGESPESLRKLYVCTKFPHQEIRGNYGILCNEYVETSLAQFNERMPNCFSLFSNMKYIGIIEFQKQIRPWLGGDIGS